METRITKFDLISGTSDVSKEELTIINGGGIAYDIGFFIREMGIYAKYQGGAGVMAASLDFLVYYKPV